MPNCPLCKSKLKNRVYKLKKGTFRQFFACSKMINHTYSEEALKDIDLKLYEEKVA